MNKKVLLCGALLVLALSPREGCCSFSDSSLSQFSQSIKSSDDKSSPPTNEVSNNEHSQIAQTPYETTLEKYRRGDPTIVIAELQRAVPLWEKFCKSNPKAGLTTQLEKLLGEAKKEMSRMAAPLTLMALKSGALSGNVKSLNHSHELRNLLKIFFEENIDSTETIKDGDKDLTAGDLLDLIIQAEKDEQEAKQKAVANPTPGLGGCTIM